MTACLPVGLFPLYGVYSCGRARPWSRRAPSENGGENNVHPSMEGCVRVRVTCVHRQSLTSHDLREEHRPELYPTSLSLSPYCAAFLLIPAPMHPALAHTPSHATCVHRECRCERASAPGAAAINTTWCAHICAPYTKAFVLVRSRAVSTACSRLFRDIPADL